MTIKELRTLAGMTQQQFSDYFHIPKRTIEDWEGGRRKPPVYVVELIEYKLRKEKLIRKKRQGN
jgi:DNA-binding transcriptional regulator YiaG